MNIKYVHAIISISIFLRKETFVWFTQTYSLVYYPPPPKKKKNLLTCWIFFTFRWKHCYFMWVLLDSNIKAMQRMFENEKQVLFLFSSLFHLIQFKREYMLEFQALYMGNMIPHEIFWKENSFIFRKRHFISTKSNDTKNLMNHVIKFCPFLFYFLYFNS